MTMEPERLTVLGAASLRFGPVVCGGLACYFGEQPLEIRFWDADLERLDLFDRFARYLFKLNKTPHLLMSTEDAKEALYGTDRVVIALDANCAEHYLGPDARVEDAMNALRPSIPDGAPVLDLWRADIPEPSEDEERALPHQMLRYLRGDEYAYEFLNLQATSPVKLWLQAAQP